MMIAQLILGPRLRAGTVVVNSFQMTGPQPLSLRHPIKVESWR